MKRCIAIFLFLSLVCTGALATWNEETAAMAEIDVGVPSAVLMEKTSGQVIFEKNSHERLPVASVTKIMTLLLVCEALDEGALTLDETLTVSAYAMSMGGSQIYLEEGESMAVRDLLKSVVVASANDAAVALAEGIAGTESAFVSKMNGKARELGMADSLFANCTGLPCEEEHYCSAYDVALMSRELLTHEFIKEYTTIWTDSVREGQFGLSNTNRLVRYYEGTTGLKTGFTQEAMYCLSASAERDGTEYIAVILHADSSDIRFETAKTLLSYAFANYCTVKAVPDEAIPPVFVQLGEEQTVQPELGENRSLLLKKSEAQGLTKRIELPESVAAPVSSGDVLGRLVIENASGEELDSIELVARTDINKLTIWQVYGKVLLMLFAKDL